MKSIIDTLLLPVYLYQGKSVRKHLVMLPEPVGEREGTVGTGDSLSLLLAGDSSAAGVGSATMDEALLGNILSNLKADFEVSFRMEARTGARTRHIIRSLNREPNTRYDIAVTVLGVNDVTSGMPQKEWLSDQRELFIVLRERFRVQHIMVSGLPPVSKFPALPQPLRWFLGRRALSFNKALERLCDEEDCHYISPERVDGDASMMASDGFHPGPGIYKAWGEEIARTIRLVRNQDV